MEPTCVYCNQFRSYHEPDGRCKFSYKGRVLSWRTETLPENVTREQKLHNLKLKEVVIVGETLTFHDNCEDCEDIARQMVALKEKMSDLRFQRKNHLSPSQIPTVVEGGGRPWVKSNKHLTPEDVSIPSTWSRQVNLLRQRMRKQ